MATFMVLVKYHVLDEVVARWKTRFALAVAEGGRGGTEVHAPNPAAPAFPKSVQFCCYELYSSGQRLNNVDLTKIANCALNKSQPLIPNRSKNNSSNDLR